MENEQEQTTEFLIEKLEGLLAEHRKRRNKIDRIKSDIFNLERLYFWDDILEAIDEIKRERYDEALIRQHDADLEAMSIPELQALVAELDKAYEMNKSRNPRYEENQCKLDVRMKLEEKLARKDLTS